MEQSLEEFCSLYNIPLHHLGSILHDPKVIPMIRGKAFEFTVADRLKEILKPEIWLVTKPFLNPQFNSHDQDVLIEHLPTGTAISVECKLSSKGEYKVKDNTSVFRIKCMRSRTLGPAKVAILSELRQTCPQQLTIHNDQYIPEDFDLIITTLANAFYSTSRDGSYIWNPSSKGKAFLKEKFGPNLSEKQYQNAAFNDMYVAKSSDLAVQPTTDRCTRRKCNNKTNCGFIPNYPLLKFDNKDLNTALSGWKHIKDIESLLTEFIR